MLAIVAPTTAPVTVHAIWANVIASTATKELTVRKVSVRFCVQLMATMVGAFATVKTGGRVPSAIFLSPNVKCLRARVTADASKESAIATEDGRDRSVTKVC